MIIQIRGQSLDLLADKCLIWKEKNILVLSDIHLNKTFTFRKAGIPIPEGAINTDIERIAMLVKIHQIDRCIIVGDLFHHHTGFTAQSIEMIKKGLEMIDCPIDLVLGNHDRALKKIPHETLELNLVKDRLIIEPFAFAHEPQTLDGLFTWAGHLHPCYNIKELKSQIRLPCFWIQKDMGVLPAFGTFVGGMSIKRRPSDKVYVIIDSHILEV